MSRDKDAGEKVVRRYTRHAAHNARALASIGIHVFPVGLRPLHPTEHGWKLEKFYLKGIAWGTEATTRKKQIAAWWDEYPDAAVGIATGPSRLAIIDRDDLDAELGPLPEGFTLPTPRQGRHHFFATPDGVEVKSVQPIADIDGTQYPGVDIKAHGGMVVFYARRKLTADDLEQLRASPTLPARFAVPAGTARPGAKAGDSGASHSLQELLDHLDDSGDYGPALAQLVEAIPTTGLDNGDMLSHFGPLVRAAWRKKGGRQAIEDAVDRYADGYAPKYRKAAWHAVHSAAGAFQAELDATPTLTPHAAPSKRGKVKKGKAKASKPGKKAKAPGPAPALEHDEWTPQGTVTTAEPPTRPADVAAEILQERILPPLAFWRDGWHAYRDGHWSALPERAIIDLLYIALKDAYFIAGKDEDGKPKKAHWAPNRARTAEVLRAIQVSVSIPDEQMWPLRLDGKKAKPLIPMRNGLLDPITGELHPRTWRLFSLQHVPADYIADAPAPKHWLRFLDTVWGNDPEQITLLQEWMGYLVSGRTDWQKFLSIVGPTRSGKGTIAAVMRHLVGEQQTVAKGLQKLTENFGLASLRGMSLAVFGDARAVDAAGMRTAAQRILEITGEDHVEIGRKHREDVSEVIRARLVLLSNSMPAFYDDSGVIADRMLYLQMSESFLDREDLGLKKRLLKELPSILLWSLEGYRRLVAQGRFTPTETGASGREMVRHNAAPILGFLEETCVWGAEYTVSRDELWGAYKRWCERNDTRTSGSQVFARALAAVQVRAYQPKLADGSRPRLYKGVMLREEEGAEERARRMWGANAGIATPTRKDLT